MGIFRCATPAARCGAETSEVCRQLFSSHNQLPTAGCQLIFFFNLFDVLFAASPWWVPPYTCPPLAFFTKTQRATNNYTSHAWTLLPREASDTNRYAFFCLAGPGVKNKCVATNRIPYLWLERFNTRRISGLYLLGVPSIDLFPFRLRSFMRKRTAAINLCAHLLCTWYVLYTAARCDEIVERHDEKVKAVVNKNW